MRCDKPTRARLSAAPQPYPKNLYGASSVTAYGSITHADKFGTDLCMRSAAPPSIAEYDAYLKSRNYKAVNFAHRPSMTGYRLRRIVIMRREGATWKECGDAVGISGSSALQWVAMLPMELAV